jgi:hypothetical protein
VEQRLYLLTSLSTTKEAHALHTSVSNLLQGAQLRSVHSGHGCMTISGSLSVCLSSLGS